MLYLDRLSRPIVFRFYGSFFTAIKRPLVAYNTHSGVTPYNLKRNIPIFNMKQKNYEFCLYLKVLYFESKGSLNILEYRCLLIGRVQYLYTNEPAVENIAYHRLQ